MNPASTLPMASSAAMSTVVAEPVLRHLRIPAILGVLALAATLRLAALGHGPLWMDEAATAAFARLAWPDLLFGIGRLETNPPAFYALEHLWTALAGTSPFVLRLPVALAGIAGVAAIWAFTRTAFGPRAAVCAAMLVSAQAHHIDLSREARVYPLLFLMVVLAAIAARAAARWQGGPRPWPTLAGLAAASGAAILLHHTGAIAALAVFTYAATIALHCSGPRAPRLALLAASGILALLIGAPALHLLLHQAADAANNARWIPEPDAVLTAQIVLSVLAVPLAGIRDLAPATIGLAFLLAAAVIAAALIPALRRARTHADAAALLAALLVAIAAMHLASLHTPILIERTLEFAVVFFAPLLGAALAAASPLRRAILAAAILALQAPAWAALANPIRHGEDFKGLAALLQQEHAVTPWPVVMLGGFQLLALDLHLHPRDPARPALSLSPPIGQALNTAVTEQLTAAAALPASTSIDALCTALANPQGLLLVTHRTAIQPEAMVPIHALLAARGGHRTAGPPPLGRLGIERWADPC